MANRLHVYGCVTSIAIVVAATLKLIGWTTPCWPEDLANFKVWSRDYPEVVPMIAAAVADDQVTIQEFIDVRREVDTLRSARLISEIRETTK